MEEANVDVSTDPHRVPCEVYSRIVGYVRPVRNWNEGKKQEFTERTVYSVPPILDKEPETALL